MKGITKLGHDKHKYMNAIFEPSINEEQCSACEACLDRCPVGAITVEDTAIVDRNKCLGCGLCASGCPSEAITMILRDDAQEPFERALELGLAILQGKQESVKEHLEHLT
jgi:ferredoxin